MKLSRIAPELRGPLRRMPPLPPDRTWSRSLTRRLIGVMPAASTPGVTMHAVEEGGARVRVHRPRSPGQAALLWIHGGGMVIGGAVQDDRFCGETAAELGIVVVAVEYRLAPEHPYPAPLEDCAAAWAWLQGNAQRLGVDPARVVVGGQSAGGGLAAGLVLRIRDEGGVQPLAELLFCPMIDDRTAADRGLDATGHRVWSNRYNRFGWRSYLGREPGEQGTAPDAAPARRADLAGLPPTWIGVGDVDLFADEDRTYAERLQRAGVPTTFHLVPGAPHGFEAWAPRSRIAREYLGSARSWLRAVIGG